MRLRTRRPKLKPRRGNAAMEVVMTIGAMAPIALALLLLTRWAMRTYHELIGLVVGSPLF